MARMPAAWRSDWVCEVPSAESQSVELAPNSRSSTVRTGVPALTVTLAVCARAIPGNAAPNKHRSRIFMVPPHPLNMVQRSKGLREFVNLFTKDTVKQDRRLNSLESP